MNTKLKFYITYFSDSRSFRKSLFECVVAQEMTSDDDVNDWLDNNMPTIMDMANAETVFDRVVLSFKPINTQKIGIKEVETLFGRLLFVDEETKDLNKTISLLRENASLLEENARQVKIIEKLDEQIVKRTYPSCWVEPDGKVHVVGFSGHSKFASEYLLNDRTLSDYPSSDKYAHQILEDMGWIRILGWKDPPMFCFNPKSKKTPKQIKAVKEYCQDNTCELPKELIQ